MRLLVLLSLAACSDYEFKDILDPGPGDTGGPPGGGGGEVPGDDECGSAEGSSAVALDESCLIEAHVGTFTPVIEWRSAAPGASYSTPIVGNLTDDDGDGAIGPGDLPDVVVINESGVLTALSGDGVTTHWTANLGATSPSTPALGDLDGDGAPDVVASGWGGAIRAYRGRDGAPLWQATVAQMAAQAACGGVGIYDLDGDGKAEVVQGNVILNGQTGAIRAVGGQGTGTGHSALYGSFGVAADIDLNGTLEVVVGNALYDADGTTIWANGQSDGFVAVANFDDDEFGEIVVTTYPGRVRLQDHDGAVLWQGAYTGTTVGPPTVADFDNDGQPEIGVAGMGQYVVIDTDGTLLWSRTTQDFSSGFTGSAVFDFEGDGQAEAVYADEVSLWVFDGATGAVKLEETRHSSVTCSESPAIADVDNDGHAEILYTSYPYTGTETGLTVVGDADDSWMPARSIWNQHAYSITNVNDDGTIPSYPETNWLSYNNFRSGDLAAATGGAMADAVPAPPEVCTDECDAGLLYVTVQVGNGGMSDLPAGVPWVLYSWKAGEWLPIASGTTADPISTSATSPVETIEVKLADVPQGKLLFSVDDQGGFGVLTECHEDNNTWEIEVSCGG